MGQQRAVEDECDDRVQPDVAEEIEHRLHGIEGGVAERVIAEVDGDVGEEHQPGGEAHAP